MRTIFVGSRALARGEITRARLRYGYRPLFPDVYQSLAAPRSLYANTVGAWVWSGGRGVITGRAAAALHGARWVDENCPIELMWLNTHPPRGIICRNDRFTADEVVEINGMAVASIQRTAYDLGRYLTRDPAVRHLDALAHATGLRAEHVLTLAQDYKGARHIRRLRTALDLMDGGAQSPKETWLRLLLMDAGFPRPCTQIPVLDDSGHPFAYLDMGWQDQRIAVEYDGDQHRSNRRQYVRDIGRTDAVQHRGWIMIRVISEHSRASVISRVRRAFRTREAERRVGTARSE